MLDEPSIGIHERDPLKLIKTLRSLQQKGNSVIVVEHDKETIEHADFIVDIGPGAGKYGGEGGFIGDFTQILSKKTHNAQKLKGTNKNYKIIRPNQKELRENKKSHNNKI